jgi:hypothetical protein
MAVGAVQLVCLGLLYVLVLRGQMTERLDVFWAGSFMPETQSVRVAFGWLADRTLDLYRLAFEELTWLALALTAAGIGWLAAQRRWRTLAYVLLPWVGVVVASVLRVYPYGGNRVDLFVIPGAVLATAAATALPGRMGASRFAATWLSAVALLALALPMAWTTLNRFVLETPHLEEMRPVLARMRPLVRPGDVVYLYYTAQPAFEWYGRDLADVTVVTGGNHRDDITRYGPEVDAALARGPRTWLVFSHVYQGEREWMVAWASAQAREAARFDDIGASAHLFVRSG